MFFKILIFLSLILISKSYAALIPAENPSPLTNDAFINYQWALDNHGQKLQKDTTDDIHSEIINGKEGFDIGIKNIKDKLDSLMKKDILVAVLDTGLDLDHPELDGIIYKNQLECDNGKLPFKPTVDKDGNGFIGDCMGWNFTSKDPNGDGRTYDDSTNGHGTHVAGIISALSNNKIGIAGISNRIKILPVKVLLEDEKKATSSLTDRIAKGILYSIKMNADVINLSVGWPRVMNSETVKNAIDLAISKGIAMVVAVGNNNHDDENFPCYYPNVICVGSISLDGKISDFSNFGGKVDLLAPGESILSLYPQTLEPTTFPVKGYEIKDGTSQAAPFVSAGVGILKGIFPEITLNEILARLLLTATPYVKDEVSEKHTLGGLINISKAISTAKESVIIPDFKRVDSIYVDPNITSKINFSLPIKNLWADAHDINVKLSIDSLDIKLINDNFNIKTLLENDSFTLNIEANILNIHTDSNPQLTLNIFDKNKDYGTFKLKLNVVRTIENDTTIIKKKIQFSGEIPDKLNLSTISPFYHDDLPDYFSQTINSDKVIVDFYQMSQKDNISERTLVLPPKSKVISISKFDVNYDGLNEYVIYYLLGDTGDNRILKFEYLNHDLKSLFNIKFKPEVVIPPLINVSYIPFNISGIGKIAIPIFSEVGKIPQLDQDPNPWNDKDEGDSRRIYYLKPEINGEIIEFKTRIIDNYLFKNKISKDFNLNWQDEISIIGMLPQSRDNFISQATQFIISTGRDFKRNYYLLTINSIDKWVLKKIDTPVNLEGRIIFPNTLLTNDGPIFNSQSIFVGFHNNQKGEIDILENNNIKASYFYSTDPKDYLMSFLAQYSKGNVSYSFYQSQSKLISMKLENSKVTVSDKTISRYSFIPGKLFQELLFPITIGTGSNLMGAFYVDETLISANRISVTTLLNDLLLSPIDLNLNVPDNCKSLNPVRLTQNGPYNFSFICKDNNQWELRYLPIL